MGIGQELGDRQTMGATGQAGATGLTGPGIELLPPVTSPADQVVALAGKDLEAMAHRQVAQAQQGRDRHGAGAGQASLALAAEIVAQALPARRQKLVEAGPLLAAEGAIGPCQLAGPIKVGDRGSSEGEAGETLVDQEAIGQLQGGKGAAVGQQLGRRCVEPPALVGRRNGQHAKPPGPPGPGAGAGDQTNADASCKSQSVRSPKPPRSGHCCHGC